MARNPMAVFDQALARQQSQAELREKAAPKKPGGKRYKAIEDAPGRYVKQRA